MSSLNIQLIRNDYPGKSDAEAAEAYAQKWGFIAIIRYKNSTSSSDFTNIGTCRMEDEIRGYLSSPNCHSAEVIYDGRATALSPAPSPIPSSPATKQLFLERDNVGTHIDSDGKGIAWWVSKGGVIDEPHIVCKFRDYEKGTQALLNIPCIQQASDTGKLICTEVITFGAFCDLTSGGKPVRWAFLLAGKGLSHASWESARDSFERNGGIIVTQKEPSKLVTTSEPQSLDVKSVRFIREENRQGHGWCHVQISLLRSS